MKQADVSRSFVKINNSFSFAHLLHPVQCIIIHHSLVIVGNVPVLVKLMSSCILTTVGGAGDVIGLVEFGVLPAFGVDCSTCFMVGFVPIVCTIKVPSPIYKSSGSLNDMVSWVASLVQ